MTAFQTIQINTPPPYLSLSKDEHLPTILTIAGSDSSGGAGIEADLKTISAHRCYGMTCMTALTIQTPVKVFGIHLTPKDVLKQIIDVNLRDMRCNVIKTGMLTLDAIDVLAEKLNSMDPKEKPLLVVDPVLVATSGSTLAGDELVQLIKEKITPLANVLTPNIPECFKLIGENVKIESLDDVRQLAERVSDVTKCSNVLVKGGHIPWDKNGSEKYITDVLLMRDEQKFVVFKGHFVDTTNTHGTGCTLASAIASNLARGYSLCQSVYGGIEYVQNAVTIGCQVTKSHVKENGPINHVYAVEIPMEKMITDDCFTAHDIVPTISNDTELLSKKIGNDFFTYLINHPFVKPHWQSYINHEFVKKIADGSLDRRKFQFFVEQDYSYLIDYARVHCVAGSKAPTLEDMEKELEIVGGVKQEMDHHEKRLREDFGVKDDEYFANITRGPALKAYSRYFNDISRRGNWQELVAALTPCLMGYGYALYTFEKQITVTNESMPLYHGWLEVYSSAWYREAMAKGKVLLNNISMTYPQEQLDTLVTIFGEVCELETKFWDAALEY
ncbi:trifunctional hydroxymethylpyrimidine kinase/phosphomethylpyrimidine kinase/thiaminase NDAI_0G03010 [Naumovozyma dairenensis CBS 421]|uniref:Pyridoxamine kinase/Phosphomethylpyrimidine kinase domain-containing protein n=1 Tax=Naumovozyma dairenensis (strain ATCC 10597 / BCRC 20456 / CBS 421 / NBRC 0211 / NRRL Y-12639) TaxID=1071378 RepID=G0WE67_NAUDC|nr:hypothetical protein NDAI_0G03010 [Naumovozyma dairenensis CBS 421]CCD26078.2 hypothetical protein NDAI_0G03010 [Naumovozyma dairenensis CBS 421]